MPHVDGDDDGVGYGVVGSSSRSIGILGKSDSGYGIFGSSSSGDGVVGSSRNKNGVNGWSTEADGVHGVSSLGYGVYGYSSNPKLSGVYGENGNVDSTCTGVHGWCYRGSGVLGFSPFGYGVTGGSEDGYGVYGGSFSGDGVFGVSVSRFGLHGSCPSEVVVDSDGNLIIGGCGVCGDSISGVGVYGRSRDGDGVRGRTHSLFSSGVLGMNDRGVGVFGFSDTGDSVYGYSNSGRAIYGTSPSPNGYAAYLDGRVYIGGPLEKPGGSFKIDHPLDPTNKFLCHSFVESPDMKNVYDGVVVLDDNGESEIELPDWFGALNKDFRYQLTAIGAPGPNLYIAKEISDTTADYSSNNSKINSFKIAGGKSDMKVSWQVTGIRKDPWANANRIEVEVEKSNKERGYYLHPNVYGKEEENGISQLSIPKVKLDESY